MITTKANNIDDYIAGFPEEIRERLREIRETIQQAAPDAAETIKYAIPTFTRNGNLVHFAAFTNHIGFYPAPSGIKEFEEELKIYKAGKGTLQFSHQEPLPLKLITRIVKFRVREDIKKAKPKKSTKK